MQTTLTSVASAAVISGDLIIGLSDGSIINCGRVQGPQGLTGDQGPMGATGLRGTDGNTVHTVQGTPDTTLGKDGDFAINVKIWEIYGPRSGGIWGTGTPLRGNLRGGDKRRDTTQDLFGSQSGSAFTPRVSGGTTYGSSFPTSLRVGDQHVMSNTLYEYVFTGGAWMQIVGPGGGSGGGSGGATTLGALADVNLSGTQKGDVIIATDNSTWENSHVLDGGTY